VSDPVDIQAIREAIEALDARLIALLSERMDLVERVSQWKLDAAAPFRDPVREEHVIRRVRGLAVEQGIDAHAVEDLYRRIMAMSIAHQQAWVAAHAKAPLRVAYQGVEGSYSHLAAQARYGGRDDETAVLLRRSQAVLAELIGTTRSRVNFFMNKFRKLGFIEYNGHLKVHSALVSTVLHD